MGTPVTLERFDPATGAAPEPEVGGAPDDAAPAPEAAPSAPDADAAMPSSEAPRAEPAPDTAADTAASRDAELARLVAALEQLAGGLDGLRAGAWPAAVRLAAEAAVETLPALAEAGFAAEAAAAIRAVLPDAPGGEVALRLSEPDHDRVLEALAGAETPALDRLAARIDPGLAPGELRLDWPEGGLALDRDRLAEAMRARLAALTDTCASTKETPA